MQKTEDTEKPVWLKRDFSEVEALIVKFARQGMSSEDIGALLRDTYGIPKVKLFNNSKITDIIKKAGINQEPQDLNNLKKNAEKLEKHLQLNKQDEVAKRSLHIIKDRINKSVKYHNKKGILN